jgi:hypothetical protein
MKKKRGPGRPRLIKTDVDEYLDDGAKDDDYGDPDFGNKPRGLGGRPMGHNISTGQVR